MKLTKQIMFNRAYRGLARQKWKQCIGDNGECVYNGPRGTHCAYGWIDPKVPDLYNVSTSISTLRSDKIGVAASLTDDLFSFACDLQTEHDSGEVPRAMRAAFHAIAKQHNLKIPAVRK